MLKSIRISLIAIAILSGWYFLRPNHVGHRDYVILSEVIPDSLDLKGFDYDRTALILYQLHQPLLTMDSNGFSSSLLDQWRSDEHFRNFTLCLKPEVTFSDGTEISAQDVVENLRRLERERLLASPIHSITVSKLCSTVSFDRAFPSFLSVLTGFQASLVKTDQSGHVLAGISDFTLHKISDDYAELIHHGPDSSEFDRIRVVTPSYLAENPIRPIHEINLVSEKIRERIDLNDYVETTQIMPNMTYLIISHPDQAVRKAISSCFDKDRYFKAIAPILSKYKVRAANSFFPSEFGQPDTGNEETRNCVPYAGRASVHIIQFYPDPAGHAASYFKWLGERSGIHFTFISKPHWKIKTSLESVARRYQTFMIGQSGFNPFSYLEIFLSTGPQRFSDIADTNLQEEFTNLMGIENSTLRLSAELRNLGWQLTSEDYALPLYEIGRSQWIHKSVLPPKIEYISGVQVYKVRDLKLRSSP